MRPVSSCLARAMFLGLMLSAGSARGDCCDPPIVATSYRPTSFTMTTLVPTAFVTPTVIEPTVYVDTPLVYQPTSYVVESTQRQSLLSRIFNGNQPTTTRTVYDYQPTSFVEVLPPTFTTTSYVPTAFTTTSYLPTSTYVPTSRIVQGPVVTLDPCAVVTSATVLAQPQSATPAAPSGAAPRPFSGTGAGLGGGSSNASPEEPGLDYSATGAARKEAGSTGGNRDAVEPPIGPAEEPPIPPLGDEATRTALKPAATEMRALPAGSVAGALRGTVVSATTGTAKADVKVVFTDSRQTYRDRERLTDSSGRFEVLLPNGDWVVNIQEADGKLTPFGSVTSASGRFLDDRDRTVSSLRLNH